MIKQNHIIQVITTINQVTIPTHTTIILTYTIILTTFNNRILNLIIMSLFIVKVILTVITGLPIHSFIMIITLTSILIMITTHKVILI
jgi:hypothetical protein